MDFIKQLGILGFGSRMKRLSDRIMTSAGSVYRILGVDFEARWFATFYLLIQSGKSMTVSEIAENLSISHPAAIQITSAMMKNGLLSSSKDKNDGRKRLLTITKAGFDLLPELEPIWNDFALATQHLFEEADVDMISAMEKVENALDRNEIAQRVIEQTKQTQYNQIKILEFKPELKKYFDELNREWITKYFEIESIDEQILSDPETEILSKGGIIIFAELNGEIVGTGALEKLDKSIYVISKMAVKEEYQGKQIGLKLAHTLINKAKELNANQVVLITDNKLEKALSLYRKLGFSITGSKFANSNLYKRATSGIFMKLDLQ